MRRWFSGRAPLLARYRVRAVRARGFVCALLALGLAACASSVPIRYYALSVPAGAPASGPAHILVEVLPVTVPERLNRVEMVLNGADGRLEVRDNDHWAAPLADEIGRTVDEALWRDLRAADTYQAPVASAPNGPPQYRLALRIERFQAGPSTSALVSGSWTVRRLPLGPSATCRADLAVPLSAVTPDAAAPALARATGDLAALITDSIARLDRGGGAVCPTSGG
jgi:uncharacterized protein